jgi:hypothetical protein
MTGDGKRSTAEKLADKAAWAWLRVIETTMVAAGSVAGVVIRRWPGKAVRELRERQRQEESPE